MTKPVLFYSWQSDLPRRSTRDIIYTAAAQAIGRLANRLSLQDAPRLDHDTLHESGAPAIAETIYSKIKCAAIVLADVTLVGKTEARDGRPVKLLPNPNVMLELGFAAATLGWERIILVMNKELGEPENLPFDLRNRRFPITFSAKHGSDQYAKATEALTDDLETAIATCLSADYQRVEDTLERLPQHARKLLAKHGADNQFFEKSPTDNPVLSQLDLAISLFLELGVVRCVQAATETGHAYEWTYLGKQCALKLGVVFTRPSIDDTRQPEIVVGTSWYDSLGKKPE